MGRTLAVRGGVASVGGNWGPASPPAEHQLICGFRDATGSRLPSDAERCHARPRGVSLRPGREPDRGGNLIRTAFPGFHNRIDELVAEANQAAARLTYTGTHRGTLFDRPPTGHRVEYTGGAFFQISGGLIQGIWVLGAENRRVGRAWLVSLSSTPLA